MTYNKLKVVIISDSTGETATGLVRAAMAQFQWTDFYFTRFKNVSSSAQIDSILEQVKEEGEAVVTTLVAPELRLHLNTQAQKNKIRVFDAMGPLLTYFSNILEKEPDFKPGSLRETNQEYFSRVEAIEFTLNHDDGRTLNHLKEADIILLGISRTSKTPLSIYLSMAGRKVVNVPLIQGTPIPPQLFDVNQARIFALTIDPEELQRIRTNRIGRLSAHRVASEYCDPINIENEVRWAEELFKENRRWPVINVTGRAVEDSASEIQKIYDRRFM